ncbi:MAG: MFS transporter, partial [Candidatus Methanomethylophilus sp.]|nr:MFS transporter [Methanomethylophilus sp.]
MQEEYLDRRHTGMMLTVVLFATLMDGLDGSIVTVAAPDIGIAFGVDTATISWVAITYMMVLAGSLILFARIAANYGIRQILAVGLALFTVSSLLCAVSVNFPMLIVGRILQGIGAAMMGATGPMCCARFLPPRRLGFGLALLTVGASVGFAVGPGVGGLIVEYLSWHWIFLINLPLGLIAIPLALAALPKEQNRGRTSIDWIGAALLAGAVVLGILAVETVSYPSQRPLTIGTGLGCLMLLVLFVRQELRTARPLLNVRLFRNLSFAGLFLCLALINLVYMGIWYLIPFYGEIWLGYISARIGLYLLLSALITAVFGVPVARLSD